MALKRLDEEFDLKPGTQLLPYMQRLLPSLEGRFQSLESEQDIVKQLTEEIRAAALMRMNEILIPATEDIIAVTKLGFLLGPVSTPYKMVMGYMAIFIDEGPQRNSFTPSPYLIVEHSVNDYAIARLIGYHQDDGLLEMEVTAIHGNAGPHDSWMVSSTPGMADSTKIYHDEIAPMHTEVVADHAEVVTLHAEIMQAAEDLAESGLDLTSYVRKDGTRPFTAVQPGVHPAAGSNDVSLTTTGWTRSRIIEYTSNAVQRGGDTMTGALRLSGPPTDNLHATTKAYVDAVLGAGGIVNANLTLSTVSPTLGLRTTGAAQTRAIVGFNPGGAQRWAVVPGDSSAESSGNAGSNFQVVRYSDAGASLDAPLTINRATGAMAVKALSYTGGLSGTGNHDALSGDMWTYRAGNTATGILWMNAAKSAYHIWDGATHLFVGGGLSTNGGALSCGTLNCNTLSTNGYGATTWGLTSHGAITVNGAANINGSIRMVGAGSCDLELYDNDWGPMWLHHNNDLIGFLSNGRGWVMYTTNAGHIWTPQYGWIHDYVTQTASNYAWSAANTRYEQVVRSTRLVYAGEGVGNGNENFTHGVMSASGYVDSGYGYGSVINKYRYIQVEIGGGWYTTTYA
jgi:hypothetical protein